MAMPRSARRKSESGIYHIMLRGINRQQIFEDEEDRQRFTETLFHYQAVCGYRIYGYCLMGNHIHLLLKEGKEDLTLILKRVAGSYVYWYNWKYRRSGHLFQDRFKSEPVDDDGYFLTVLRYIHQNPVKAGICKRVEDYPHSSYCSYFTDDGLVDVGFALSMLPLEEFVSYHKQLSTDRCLEVEESIRLNDEDAKAILFKITRCRSASDFQRLPVEKRNKHIEKLHKRGLSIRQISRLTGIPKKTVEDSI